MGLRVRTAAASGGSLCCTHDQVSPRVRLHWLTQLTHLKGKPTKTLNTQVDPHSPSSSIHTLVL